MSKTDGSQDFDPEKIAKERESSDISNTVANKAFSRVGVSYIAAFIIGLFVCIIIGDTIAGILYPLPELPVSAGEQGFETSGEIDSRYQNHAMIRNIFFTLGLFFGPLSWYVVRRYWR